MSTHANSDVSRAEYESLITKFGSRCDGSQVQPTRERDERRTLSMQRLQDDRPCGISTRRWSPILFASACATVMQFSRKNGTNGVIAFYELDSCHRGRNIRAGLSKK
jgi:hypothetical protein